MFKVSYTREYVNGHLEGKEHKGSLLFSNEKSVRFYLKSVVKGTIKGFAGSDFRMTDLQVVRVK